MSQSARNPNDMYGFEDNPFGEPTIDNPFEDPSVRHVTQTSNSQIRVDDYDPFNQQKQQPLAYNQSGVGNHEPAAVMQTTPAQPPPYARSGAQQEGSDNARTVIDAHEQFQRRVEELDRKEEELNRREAEQRENNVRRNNWPPLPDQCCFQPCFYQDINVDIQPEFQKVVRHLYYLWIFHGMLMLLNVIGGIILVDFTVIGVGILYTLLFTPFSYLCWFRPAYKAFRFDSSFNFMVFFFVFFFQFIVTVMQTLGLQSSGTVGIFTAISCFDGTPGGIITGILILLLAIGFGVAAAADLFMLSKIHRIYRSSGASFAKARAELTTEFLSNQHVRSAASDAAVAAVQYETRNMANRY